MPNVSMKQWERHNVVVDKGGRLVTRKGGVAIHTPADVLVGGFSILVPSSSEMEHYLFEQSATTSVVTLFVYDEEFNERYRLRLGEFPSWPVFTHGMTNNQLMINSPSLSAPLYGLPGGGVMPAVKTPSENPDTTSIDIPSGHICAFGDRLPIAQGSVVYFNDPGVDPRSYVGENTVPLPATIHDIVQGPDGALWMFTPAGAYNMAADALGQGQSVAGFISLTPEAATSRPGNAASTIFGVVALTDDGVLVLNGGNSRAIPFSTYQGRRRLSQPVDVLDARQFGRVFPTSTGAVVGFGVDRNYCIHLDLQDGGVSFLSSAAVPGAFHAVGVLRTRDGEDLLITPGAVWSLHVKGNTSNTGVLCGRIQAGPADNPLLRRVTVSAANAGEGVTVNCNNVQDSANTSLNGDAIIGVNNWGAPLATLTARSARCTLNVRGTELDVEVAVAGRARVIVDTLELQAGGTWRTKKETQA
jgi:hypothetical protein